MFIRAATPADVTLIHQLARQIWWPAYRDVISDGQISFMLQNMYSKQALQQQIEEGINFLIAERENIAVAFAGCSLTDLENGIFKLHKLYVLPSEQGKGTGKKLIEHVTELARQQGGKILELNVNRKNKAYGFYQKLGFVVYQKVDIPYFQFEMNDYVMRKNLSRG